MKTKYKYVFIGAGTANLTAANYLLDIGENNLLVIEKGKKLDNRVCPGEDKKTCYFCKRGCDITEGVGGAAAFYGNKLCYFPASSQILTYFSKEAIDAGLNYLDDLLYPFFNSEFVGSLKESRHSQFDSKKRYIADILTKHQFMQLINIFLNQLNHYDCLKTNTEVISIKRKPSGIFEIITEDDSSYTCEKLILGSGRSSCKFLRQTFKGLGIRYIENSQDLGIRIEAAVDNFSDSFYYQLDPKFKFQHSSKGSSRTFCGCKRGMIVPVQYEDSFYADGVFSQEFTNLTNVALMVRRNLPLDPVDLENWCKQINKLNNYNLVLHEIDLDTENWKNMIIEIVEAIDYWPEESYKAMIIELLRNLLTGENCILKESVNAQNTLKVYAPAIDRYWPRPLLSKSLESNISNLFILGDATGVSRGFVQAMISGAAWAISNIKNRFELRIGENQYVSNITS